MEMAKHAACSTVAEHFGCSHSTVRRFVQSASSPAHRSVKTAPRTPADGTKRSNEPDIKGKTGLAKEPSAKSGTDTVPERPVSKVIPSGRSAVPESLPLKANTSTRPPDKTSEVANRNIDDINDAALLDMYQRRRWRYRQWQAAEIGIDSNTITGSWLALQPETFHCQLDIPGATSPVDSGRQLGSPSGSNRAPPSSHTEVLGRRARRWIGLRTTANRYNLALLKACTSLDVQTTGRAWCTYPTRTWTRPSQTRFTNQQWTWSWVTSAAGRSMTVGIGSLPVRSYRRRDATAFRAA